MHVEGTHHERPSHEVDEVPGREVVRVDAAFDNRPALACADRLNEDVPRRPRVRAGEAEQNRVAVGQQLKPPDENILLAQSHNWLRRAAVG